MSLPNPALALMHEEQMEENVLLADQSYARSPSMKSRRLMVAMDATYLLRGLQQMMVRGKAGLVGLPWRPQEAEPKAFVPVKSVPKKEERAPQILEFLCWDPMAVNSFLVSLASMPMSLKAPKLSDSSTLTHSRGSPPCIHTIHLVFSYTPMVNHY